MMPLNKDGGLVESSMRIGRWKEMVSSVQRARKKTYWNSSGWVVR